MREENHVSMNSIRGRAKMCCLASDPFREQVIALARANGTNLQDFLLAAVRDKVYGDRKARLTVEGRRRLALERLFRNKRASQELKDTIDFMLKKYLP